MPSRIPRSEAASIAQSTKAPAGWFTARKISRSAGGATAGNLPRGTGKSSGIGQRADARRSRAGVEWDDGRSRSRRALRTWRPPRLVGALPEVRREDPPGRRRSPPGGLGEIDREKRAFPLAAGTHRGARRLVRARRRACRCRSAEATPRPPAGGAVRDRAPGELAGPGDGRDQGGGKASDFGRNRPDGPEPRPQGSPVAPRGRDGTYRDRGLGHRAFAQRGRELAAANRFAPRSRGGEGTPAGSERVPPCGWQSSPGAVIHNSPLEVATCRAW